MTASLVCRFIGIATFAAFSGLSILACEGNTTTTSNSSSGGGGDGGGGSGGGSNGGSNGERYAAAFCGRIFDCCNATDLPLQVRDENIKDYAGCRIMYRTVWEAAFEAVVREGEKAGRVAFNQANFDACLESMTSTACPDLNKISLVCSDIFTPKVAVGQECYSGLECIDSRCEIPNGSAAGTCVAKPAPVGLGGACMSDTECDAGLFCDAMACVAQKAEGETCASDIECTSKRCIGTTAKTCQTICKGDGPGPGSIDALLEPIGAPLALAQCDKIFECCAADEYEPLLFASVRTKQQCYALYGVFSGLAMVQLHNSLTEGKIAIEGTFEPCIDAYSTLTCSEFAKGASLDCDTVIKGLVVDGAVCTEDNQCVSKYCNEPMPDQGTCGTVPGLGETCNADCAQGLYCVNGTCAAQKAIGESCTSTTACLEGRCHGPSGMKTCALICDGI